MKQFLAAVFLALFAFAAAPLLADGPDGHAAEHHVVHHRRHHVVHHRHHAVHHEHVVVVHHDAPVDHN